MRAGPGGLPACHGAESTRKDLPPEEKKMLKGQKKTFIHSKTRLPFGEWDVSSGVTQAGMPQGKLSIAIPRYS